MGRLAIPGLGLTLLVVGFSGVPKTRGIKCFVREPGMDNVTWKDSCGKCYNRTYAEKGKKPWAIRMECLDDAFPDEQCRSEVIPSNVTMTTCICPRNFCNCEDNCTGNAAVTTRVQIANCSINLHEVEYNIYGKDYCRMNASIDRHVCNILVDDEGNCNLTMEKDVWGLGSQGRGLARGNFCSIDTYFSDKGSAECTIHPFGEFGDCMLRYSRSYGGGGSSQWCNVKANVVLSRSTKTSSVGNNQMMNSINGWMVIVHLAMLKLLKGRSQ